MQAMAMRFGGVRANRAQQPRVHCAANPAGAATPAVVPVSVGGRRALLALIGASVLATSLPASALIPDDYDEELLAKAKANRKTRIIEEKDLEQRFLAGEGLSPQVAAVSKAVKKLKSAGRLLKAGDEGSLKELDEVLGEGRWVPELRQAATELGAGKGAEKMASAMLDGIAGLQASAKKRDAAAAKLDYLAAVSGLEYFARATGIAGLPGL